MSRLRSSHDSFFLTLHGFPYKLTRGARVAAAEVFRPVACISQ
jgi:hypothetical protein